MTEYLYMDVRVFALLLLLSAALLSGCLGLDRRVQSVEASAGAASGGPAETSKVPESTIGTSHIDSDLAEANGATSHAQFVEKTEDSGGSGLHAESGWAVPWVVTAEY